MNEHEELVFQNNLKPPNLTSMIDIVFILLLFFILSSANFLQRAIPVKQTSGKESQEIINKPLNLILKTDGQVYFDNQPLSTFKLKMLAKKQVDKNPDLVVVLHPDANTVAQKLVETMDILRALNITKIAIGETQ